MEFARLFFGISILVLFLLAGCSNKGQVSEEDAQCLTDQGVKFYGAWWCTHCKNNKEYFGKSFENINYIECAPSNGQGQTEVCQQAGITGYPTWELANGTRIEGEIPNPRLSFEQFLEMTGCADTLNTTL